VISARLAATLLLATPVLGTAERAPLLLDDFSRPDGRSALGTAWRAFTDQLMGPRPAPLRPILRAGGDAERCESQSDQGSSVHPHSSSRDGCLPL
jgi:hypothetical protein